MEAAGKKFDIIKYMDEPLLVVELERIIDILGIKPIDLVRKNEIVWKESYKGKEMTDSQIIKAMATHPKLIERPIVINGRKGVIGRPAEKILEIL